MYSRKQKKKKRGRKPRRGDIKKKEKEIKLYLVAKNKITKCKANNMRSGRKLSPEDRVDVRWYDPFYNIFSSWIKIRTSQEDQTEGKNRGETAS